MTNIQIWSDFACPYCYIGETRLDNAIHDLGLEDKVNVTYRSYELDRHTGREASLATVERYMKKYRMSEADAQRQVDQVQQMMRDMGLECNYAGAQMSNTFDAHRLMKLAEAQYDKATVYKLNNVLFDAYFARNLVLAHRDVLEQLAAEAGLKADDVKRVLDSDEYADAVRADEREAEKYGVKGVPYFLIDGKMAVPGAVSTEDFKELLLRFVEHKDKHEKEAPLHDKHPHRCTENGCELA